MHYVLVLIYILVYLNKDSVYTYVDTLQNKLLSDVFFHLIHKWMVFTEQQQGHFYKHFSKLGFV